MAKHIACCTQTASRVRDAPDGRATAESRRAAPRLLRTLPRRGGRSACANEGADEREHDEAVEMVNFLRNRKHAKCVSDKQTRKSLLTGSRAPGSRSEVRYGDVVRGSVNSENF